MGLSNHLNINLFGVLHQRGKKKDTFNTGQNITQTEIPKCFLFKNTLSLKKNIQSKTEQIFNILCNINGRLFNLLALNISSPTNQSIELG
jgi:DNA-binding transcriptional regulator GbsR (MarR family)